MKGLKKMTLIDILPMLLDLNHKATKGSFPTGAYIYVKRDNKGVNHCYYCYQGKTELADGKYVEHILDKDWHLC